MLDGGAEVLKDIGFRIKYNPEYQNKSIRIESEVFHYFFYEICL